LVIIFFGNAFLQLNPSPQSNKIGQKEPTLSSDFHQKTDKKNRPLFPIFAKKRTKRTDPFFRFFIFIWIYFVLFTDLLKLILLSW